MNTDKKEKSRFPHCCGIDLSVASALLRGACSTKYSGAPRASCLRAVTQRQAHLPHPSQSQNPGSFLSIVISAILLLQFCMFAETADHRVNDVYPDLACGVLTHATLGDLPNDVLLESDGIRITTKDLDNFISQSWISDQLKNFPFFALEQESARRIVASLARKHTRLTEGNTSDDNLVIGAYLESVIRIPEVNDEEISAFYEQIKSTLDLPLEQIKDQIRWQIRQDKWQDAVNDFIRNLGRRVEIIVSDAWIKQQAKQAKLNPIDQARASGKPTLVVFSSVSCCGPDTTIPIMKEIERKYAEFLNIVHLDARDNQVLAARFSVKSIPIFILYNKQGGEVFRRTGSIELSALLAEIKKLEVN